jgi:hypothetical protein
MRQRQSRRVKNQAKKACEGRVAAYLHALEKKNATKLRRSLRLAVNRVVAPYRVILFGEQVFFLEDVNAKAPPPEDDRMRGNGSADGENSANVKTYDDESTTSNNSPAVGSTRSELVSKDDDNNEDGISTDSSREFAFFASWLYPYPVGCPSTDSDQE